MGYREVAMDSGYMEQDDYEDGESPSCAKCGRVGTSFIEEGGDLFCFECAGSNPRDLTCEICGDSLTRCPHGRSDFEPAY